MSLALNKPKLDNLADEIWKSAERLRGKFKAYEYQNVILPIIVIRRKEHLLGRAATPEQKAGVEKLVTVHGQELSPPACPSLGRSTGS